LTQLPSLAHILATPKYEEVSGFGSLTYHFNEKFDIQVGGRYAHIKFDGDIIQSGPLVGNNTIASHVSQNVFTFLVNPRYKLSDTQMVYGRLTSGYRPGGSNAGVPGVSQSFDSDRTVNYEVGYKAQLLDRALTVDASLFDIEWNKIQLQAAAPNGLSYISNGGKARSRGAELATTYSPGHGLTVRGNLAYTDAEMRKAVTSGIIAAAGDQLPFSAKWSGSLSADETFAITGDVNGFVGATFSFVGKRFAAFTTRPTDQRFVMPSYSTLDLRAGADFDRYTVAAFVRNVTDKIGFVSGTPRDSITRAGLYEAGVIAPRTFGVSLAASF
jgi:outer membrane receptor protein involved in Fe transport